MSTIRFNQLWIALLALSLLSAFIIPQHYSDRVRNVQELFAPIAWPARKIAARFDKPQITDTRADTEIREENQQLKTELIGVIGQLEELRRRNADRDLLGDLRQFCSPVSVMGVATDNRESLILPAALDGVAENQCVLYSGGLAGKIQRAGLGAQVRLITDNGFSVTGWFMRLERDSASTMRLVPCSTTIQLLRGAGKGEMKVYNLSRKESEKLAEGDLAVLDDPAWPKALQYRRLGKVVGFEDIRGSPLHVNVRVKPEMDLMSLREVMVMTKDR
jgi:cell shape-determining protein MreC